MNKKAVVILSGGLDSTTCMGIASQAGYEIYALTFNYGQRHDKEIEHARHVAEHYQAREHRIVNMDFLQQIGGSALTDDKLDIPTHGEEEGIPITYVPARNIIFLSLATSYAEVVGAERIYIGVSGVDYSGYPDCRPEFIEAMNEAMKLGTKTSQEKEPLVIEAPLAHLSKAATIKWGHDLDVPYHLTTSCYQGETEACGVCDSCRLRLKGFRELGLTDPISYR
ncbi:7-cyano-7-deazaguanine synthase QueC [Mechercharimyces sp. CAU 1602]|uniref:7-cyano-7-deazaguanine synthase QueC n=1 Tax=Mechercharimyces sp. CAU 1602 TaxID=2973933 RepID=UPI002161BDC3|nr:7-cyano-7-deazaguanine synthase QueC [Mechercharimyces sp. CAU 1602]MCS1351583.1 7-cyano-7-deazaguanine synthase QueC [Mechercharimyces sp. CAU 1602]